jgi:hypothetical protein
MLGMCENEDDELRFDECAHTMNRSFQAPATQKSRLLVFDIHLKLYRVCYAKSLVKPFSITATSLQWDAILKIF